MGGNPITNEVAKKALEKLQAVREPGDAHPTFGIYHENILIASTGIRHSSKKDISLPHIKRDLRVSAGFVLGLARCPKSREDWLREVGAIPAEEPPEVQPG